MTMKRILFMLLAVCVMMTGGCLAAGRNGGSNVSNPTAIMETNMGTIEIELYLDKTPVTAQNFIDLSKKGFYDGVIFHRVIDGFLRCAGIYERGIIVAETLIPVLGQHVVDIHKALGVNTGHAMVARDDEVDLAGNGQQLNAGPHLAQQQVHVLHGTARHAVHRAVVVTTAVRLFKIGHHQVGALVLGQAEQPDDFIDAAGIINLLGLIVQPIGGMLALNGHVTAHPKDCCRFHALVLGSEPHGVSPVIIALAAGVLVAQRELHTAFTIPKSVGDDAVVVRSEARGQRVMVGERLAGERRLHHGFDALARQLLHERHVIGVQVVPTQSVQRDNHRVIVASCRPSLQRQHGHQQYKINQSSHYQILFLEKGAPWPMPPYSIHK
ncbi:MAG: peptidylprolyl isomerase [Muribaculaceae bacterium]|nr:peptidylprolyl isomerase [Muribaculaceae bacterium]